MERKIVPVRFPADLIELIESIRKSGNVRRKADPLTLSAWIRQACREKINHAVRSKNKAKTYTCCICGMAWPVEQIAWENAILGNPRKKERTCKKCAYNTKTPSHTPLLDHGPKSSPEQSPNVG